MCSRLQIFRQRNNGKVIFPLNHTSTPQPLFLHPHLWPFEQNRRFQFFSFFFFLPSFLLLLLPLPLLPLLPSFFFFSFSFCQETSTGLSFRRSQITGILSRKVMHCRYISKHCPFCCWGKLDFPGTEFSVDSDFLAPLEKGCGTSFQSPWFLMRNLRYSNCCFPTGNVCFSLVFKIFSCLQFSQI